MPAKPLLLLDCDLEPGFGEGLFRPWLTRANVVSVHAPGGNLPTDVSRWSSVVLTGSAATVHEEEPWSVATTRLVRGFVDAGVPLLGVCYGHQLLGEAVGGRGTVFRREAPEVGFLEVRLERGDPLLDALPERFTTFLTHADEVRPTGAFEVLGTSASCPVQAIRVPGRPAWGVQFHTEYSPAEQLRLIRKRQAMHPQLGLDADALFAARPDTGPQARALFGRFLELAGW